jgi:hypothetical protein
MKNAYKNLTTSRVTMSEIGTRLVKINIQVKYLYTALRIQYLSKMEFEIDSKWR